MELLAAPLAHDLIWIGHTHSTKRPVIVGETRDTFRPLLDDYRMAAIIESRNEELDQDTVGPIGKERFLPESLVERVIPLRIQKLVH